MVLRSAALSVVLFAWCNGASEAANIAPPMLDITRQCETMARRNVTAMSECVVAESEARAELLQNWTKFSDASAEKCIKAGRKAMRHPYSAMAKCLSVDAIANGRTEITPSGKR